MAAVISPEVSSAAKTQQLPGTSTVIDASRGAAAFAVLLFHGFLWILAPWNPDAFDGEGPLLLTRILHPVGANWAAPLYPLLGFGFLGVNLFFIISGFCIHLPNARGSAFSLDIPRFLLRRLVRLYPLYLIVTLALFIIYGPITHQYLDKGVNLKNFLGHLVFWHYLGPPRASGMGISGVMWTIALEVQFYFIYALLYPLIRSVDIGRLALIWTAFDLAYHLLWPLFGAHFQLHPVFSPARFAPTRFGEWLLGAWLAERYVAGTLGARPWRTICRGSLLIGVGIAFGFLSNTDRYIATDVPGCIGFMMILNGLLQLELQGRLQMYAVMKWLGDRSYSLYLVHATIVLVVAKFLSDHYPRSSQRPALSLFFFLLASILAVIVAAGAYRFIEAPSHRLARHIKQVSRSKRTQKAR